MVASDNTRDPVLRLWRPRHAGSVPRGDAHPPSRPFRPALDARCSARRRPRSWASPATAVIAAGGPADLVLTRARTLHGAGLRARRPTAPSSSPAAPSTRRCRITASSTTSTRRDAAAERPMPAYDIDAPEAAHRRHPPRGQSGAGAAEEPRLLLVLAGAQAAARAVDGRHRRLRRRARRSSLQVMAACFELRHPGDAARHRHRQLRPGDAAVGRRRARPLRPEPA